MRRVHLGPRGPSQNLLYQASEPVPDGTGSLACTDEKHRMEDLTEGFGAPLCGRCFGWSDDPRHILPWHWQYVEDAICKRYEDRKW